MGFWRDTLRGIWAEPEPPLDRSGVKTRPVSSLARIRTAPTREAFRAWRSDPTTRFAFAALDRAADMQAQAWVDASWSGGQANPLLLAELRTRADAYKSLSEADYEGFCEWLGVEPEPVGEENGEGSVSSAG